MHTYHIVDFFFPIKAKKITNLVVPICPWQQLTFFSDLLFFFKVVVIVVMEGWTIPKSSQGLFQALCEAITADNVQETLHHVV